MQHILCALFPISRDFIYFGIVRKNQVSISLHIILLKEQVLIKGKVKRKDRVFCLSVFDESMFSPEALNTWTFYYDMECHNLSLPIPAYRKLIASSRRN